MVDKPSYEELEQKIETLEKEAIIRKQVTKALRESEYKLNNLLQNTPIAAITWDLNFRVSEWNPAAEAIFGYYKKEAIGKHPAELILSGEVKEMVDGVFTDLISEKGGARSTNENLTKDGKRIICDWYNTALKDADGKVVGVASLVHDITKPRQTELALRASEEKFRRIFDNLQDGYLWADKDGNILLANMVAANTLGYDLHELMQLNLAQDIYFVPEERETVKEIMTRTGVIENHELIFKKKDGQKIFVEANSHLVYEDNQQSSMEGTFRDITFRKQAELEKEKLESQLRQAAKMEAVGTLAGGIAHDINNILGIIIGNTELAIEDVLDLNPASQNLKEIKIASLRARDVVRQLLSFSRKSEQEKRLIEIQAILKESIKFLRASLPSTIEFISNIPADLKTIMADPTQIHQVIINLCTNAAHAMEKNGGTMEISLDEIELNGGFPAKYFDVKPGFYIQLTVRDDGCGIDPGIKNRIFDPYFTTKDTNKGSGIGLSVVHGIVKNHDGAISLHSESGKGTTLKIIVPVAHGKPFLGETNSEKLLKGNENVLFVDDETALINIGRQTLERLGYQVETSTNPAEALEQFHSNPSMFDLVITDMTMPHMTGDKFAAELLKIRSDIPIILCTGYSERISDENAGKLGIQKYIEKPLNIGELSLTIREVLDKK